MGKRKTKEEMQRLLATYFSEILFQTLKEKEWHYSEAIKTFNVSAVAIVKNIGPCILSKRNSHDEKMYYSQELIQQLSAVYGFTPPTLYYQETGRDTNGFYKPTEHSITFVNKISFVTLLHEFRHAMQYNGAKMIDRDKEVDARAWSMSLFKKALPKYHKIAIEKNLVKYK